MRILLRWICEFWVSGFVAFGFRFLLVSDLSFVGLQGLDLSASRLSKSVHKPQPNIYITHSLGHA